MFASAVMVGACFFTLRTWSTWRIPVSTAPATIWVTRAAVVVVTKFTSFASRPWRDAAFNDLDETHERDAERGDDDDRDEHPVDAEHVLVLDDQVAEPAQTDEELRDDHADQPASDREPDPRQDERQARRQDDVAPEPPLARVERSSDLEQSGVDVPHALLGVDEDREDREQDDRRDPRCLTLVAEGDRDERHERHGGDRVERAHPGIEEVEREARPAGQDPERDAGHQRDREPGDEDPEALEERELQLAGREELTERGQDGRRRPEQDRVQRRTEELPDGEHTDDRRGPHQPVRADPHRSKAGARTRDAAPLPDADLVERHAATGSRRSRQQRSRNGTKRSSATTLATVRGRRIGTSRISRTRAGRADRTTTRSPRAIASSIECVMKTIVRGSRS